MAAPEMPRESPLGRESSPARDNTSVPPAVETTTAEPSTGNLLFKASFGFSFFLGICLTPNSFLFRTLAQRAAKRTKAPVIVIEDEPTATAGGAPETTLPDPATVLQSSPQRKYMVRFPLLGAHGYSFFADI